MFWLFWQLIGACVGLILLGFACGVVILILDGPGQLASRIPPPTHRTPPRRPPALPTGWASIYCLSAGIGMMA